MPRWSAGPLVVVVLFAAACGSEDAGGSESTTSSVFVPEESVDSTASSASTTEATTSSSTSTSTSTSTTTSTPPTTTPPEPDCIDGAWWLSPEETTSLYAALLPGMPVTVTGTHWVEFSGGTADYWVTLELNFAVGGTNVTFGLDQHGVGSYTVVDDVLTITYDSFESTLHEGHGVAITDPRQHPSTYAGEAVALDDNGDGTITINRVTVPVVEPPPVAGGPIGCEDDTMSIGFTSGLADAAAVYVRRG